MNPIEYFGLVAVGIVLAAGYLLAFYRLGRWARGRSRGAILATVIVTCAFNPVMAGIPYTLGFLRARGGGA